MQKRLRKKLKKTLTNVFYIYDVLYFRCILAVCDKFVFVWFVCCL